MILNHKNRYRWLIALLVFSAFFLFLGLGNARLIDWDENIYAEASRQMIERGDYLNVVVNDHSFAEKPPFFFWEQVVSYRLFGVNEFAARFPSALAGLVMIWLCFYIGQRIESVQTGLLWGFIYLTALLPSSLARASVIDHTFNLFITSSIFFLYFFDVEYRFYLQNNGGNDRSFPIPKYLVFLTAASICMGLGVLTKGPLGGVIPLVGFGTYKLFYWRPGIKPVHFVYCAVLSLTIGFSWYTINALSHGEGFIRGFWKFQIALFTKTLEGHSGPFIYHFVIVLFGLLPWTVFLFLYRPKSAHALNPHFRPLFYLGVGWSVFVLVLMSIVSTKLPHYSASVYIPLTFIIAIAIQDYFKGDRAFPLWVPVGFSLSTAGMGILVILIPGLATRFLQNQGISLVLDWSPLITYAGAILICFGVLGGMLLKLGRIKLAIVTIALIMLIFTQSLWRFLVPPFLGYNQQPLIEMVQEAHQKGGKIVFYRLVSFAALFYGKQPIEMLHTYKFPGDPEILNKSHKENIFIMADKSNKERLLREHPLVRHIEDRGTFSLFILEKNK